MLNIQLKGLIPNVAVWRMDIYNISIHPSNWLNINKYTIYNILIISCIETAVKEEE